MDDDIPEEKLSEEELKEFKETLRRMKEGKEGISLEDLKKEYTKRNAD
jgi:hypothetical protein